MKDVQELYNKVNQVANDKTHRRLFAVIQLGNEQRKVTTEDIICKVDDFHPTIGDRIRFEKVFLIGLSSLLNRSFLLFSGSSRGQFRFLRSRTATSQSSLCSCRRSSDREDSLSKSNASLVCPEEEESRRPKLPSVLLSLLSTKAIGIFSLVWRDPLTMIRITNIEILGPIPETNSSNK